MEIETIRGIERIIAVLIGGGTIYLGYRLFLNVPEQKNSEGKLVLPKGISVYLSRVGPGVFFALFGAAVLSLSFYFQLKKPGIATLARAPIGIEESIGLSYIAATQGIADKQTLESARAEVRKKIRTLNQLVTRFREETESGKVQIEEGTRADLLIALPDIKLALIFTVWTDEWGDFRLFANWINKGASGSPPAGTEEAAHLYKGMQ